MTYHYRPLVISLLIHAFALGLFLFWLLSDKPKKADEPLKIHMASFILPAPQSVSPPKPPTPIVPKNIPMPPVVRPVIKPSPLVSRPTLPMPAAQAVPQPIYAPTPVEAPKPVAAQPIPPQLPPVNVEKEFLNAHLGEIRALLLQNLKYPKMAQKLRMQGDVRIAFSLNSDGSVENIKVVESSGFEILDEDARELIEKMAGRFPKPSKSVRISVPLSYVLH
ncbi:MAG TPA: energy transducer TonB [Sulfuricurvum sp.]|nr:energy transducer TonB [Sulfuricurvum sp.]